ncbi:hypothetical protein D3C80_1556380 [compost metagenome]
MAHHRETARFARRLPETQVFIVQRQPKCLDQLGELLRRDACAGLVEQLAADPQLLQQTRIVVATSARTTKYGAGEMTGDGAFTHSEQIRLLNDRW